MEPCGIDRGQIEEYGRKGEGKWRGHKSGEKRIERTAEKGERRVGEEVSLSADNILHEVRSSNTSVSKRSPDILEDASP